MLKPKSLEGEELIFYNYKEPLKEVEKGFGYYGVILSNKEGTKIQCHICGKMYQVLNVHARQSHGILAREYKEKYQLANQTSLISESIRQERKLRTLKWLKSMTPEQWADLRRKTKAGYDKWKRDNGDHTQPLLKLETKNKRGTCPDQLLEKIKTVAKELGRSPTKNEFIDYYKSQKYVHIIFKTFGSWVNAKRMAGFDRIKPFDLNKKAGGWKRHTKEELIEYMQIFYQENKKPPTTTDCNRRLIPSSCIFKKHFGSMQNARLAAGITDPVGRWSSRR